MEEVFQAKYKSHKIQFLVQFFFLIPQHYRWSSSVSYRTKSFKKGRVLFCAVNSQNLEFLWFGEKEQRWSVQEESTSSSKLALLLSWRSLMSNLKMLEIMFVIVEITSALLTSKSMVGLIFYLNLLQQWRSFMFFDVNSCPLIMSSSSVG